MGPDAVLRREHGLAQGSTRAFIGLDLGDFFGCLVRHDGEVVCWGRNSNRQLGLTDSAMQTADRHSLIDAPVVGTSGTNPTQTCARTGDGRLFCWGVGVLTGSSNPRAIHLNNASQITDIGVGDEHVCIRGGDGSVWCRGGNAFGQLGRGFASAAEGGFAPVKLPGGANLGNVASIHVGRFSSCAGLADGTARCWGAPFQGRLGTGTTPPDNTVAQPMSGIAHFVRGAVGNTHACAITADLAGLRCTGSDWHGELGDGTNPPVDRFTAVNALLGNFEFVSNNANLGFGGFFRFVPREAQGRAQIAGGSSHFCTIRRSVIDHAGTVQSRVYCWGRNDFGQVDPGAIDEYGNVRTGPVLRPTLIPLNGVPVSVSTSSFSSCALMSGGTVWCWGRHLVGEAGTQNNFRPLREGMHTGVFPQQVAGVSNAIALSSGNSHTCALIANGTVQCWGNNDQCQLGRGLIVVNGSNQWHSGTPEPVKVGTPTVPTGVLDHVIQIAGGGAHTCALRSDGSIHCWGRGDRGAAGEGVPQQIRVIEETHHVWPYVILDRAVRSYNGLTIPSTEGEPARVPASISANYSATCVRYASGVLECWGDRVAGQLGDDWMGGGMPTHTRAAGFVSQPAPVLAHAGGGGVNCALRSDGELFCWGTCDLAGRGANCGIYAGSYNRLSVQLADGGVPLRNVVSVALSRSPDGTACAVLADGAVRCWGSNLHGALGVRTDSPTRVSHPAVVSF